MEVAELVRLRTKLEVIKYALAHIALSVDDDCGDIEVAKKAADVCSDIVDMWAASLGGQDDADMDK